DLESNENQSFEEVQPKSSREDITVEEISEPQVDNSNTDESTVTTEEIDENGDPSEKEDQKSQNKSETREPSIKDTEETVPVDEPDNDQQDKSTTAPVNKDTDEESEENENIIIQEQDTVNSSEGPINDKKESGETLDESEAKESLAKDTEEAVPSEEQDNSTTPSADKSPDDSSTENDTAVTREQDDDNSSREALNNEKEDVFAENGQQKTGLETTSSEDDPAVDEELEEKTEKADKEKENDVVHEIQTLKLSTDKSIKLYSFDTKAKNNKPVVTKAQYAARFTDGKHSGLYSPVTSSEGVSLDFMDGKTVYITQKAVYDGTTYYRVHKNYEGAMQGWVKEKDLRLFRLSDSKKHTKDYAVSRDNEYLLTNPWGTDEQTVKRLDKYDTRLFRAEERLDLGVLTFYYGKIDGNYGWLEDSRLKAASAPKVTKQRYAAKLNTGKKSGLYSPVTSRESHSINFLKDKTLYITQKADYNGTIFYRIHQNYDGAMQSWIQNEDLDLWRLAEPKAHRKDYSIARKNEYLLTNPWGSSKQTAKKLSSYGNSLFKAEKKLDLGVLTYYYGKIGNDYGWLEETRVKDAAPVVTSARFAARVDNGKNSGIYSPVTSKSGKDMDVI